MLKVRCFKTTGNHRPFLSKFYVKLGFRHFQRCESTKQPQFNAGLAAGDYRFRKSITAGGLQPGVTIRLRYLGMLDKKIMLIFCLFKTGGGRGGGKFKIVF